MEHYWHLGRWRGVPVSLHWTVLLAFPWLYLTFSSFISALIGTAVFVFLLIAHEFGHVWAARWRRVNVESISLYFWHGETSLGYVKTRWEEVLIAWAGVGVQLGILILASVTQPFLYQVQIPLLWTVLGPVYTVLTVWNVFLILVALLPIGPMDGHKAWQVFAIARQRLRRRRELTPEKRRALEERSEKLAKDVISNLGKSRVDGE